MDKYIEKYYLDVLKTEIIIKKINITQDFIFIDYDEKYFVNDSYYRWQCDFDMLDVKTINLYLRNEKINILRKNLEFKKKNIIFVTN